MKPCVLSSVLRIRSSDKVLKNEKFSRTFFALIRTSKYEVLWAV